MTLVGVMCVVVRPGLNIVISPMTVPYQLIPLLRKSSELSQYFYLSKIQLDFYTLVNILKGFLIGCNTTLYCCSLLKPCAVLPQNSNSRIQMSRPEGLLIQNGVEFRIITCELGMKHK